MEDDSYETIKIFVGTWIQARLYADGRIEFRENCRWRVHYPADGVFTG